MRKKIMIRSVILLFALLLFSPIYSKADEMFQLNYEFSAGDQPRGPAPWLIATFADASPGTVRLTLSASGLIESEFVGGTTGGNPQNGWYFNLDPTLNPAQLVFTPVAGNFADNIFQDGADIYGAGPDGLYDILFIWTAEGQLGRLSTGEEAVYDITYSDVGTFDAASFNYLSTLSGPQGTYHTAAQVQGITVITPDGEDREGSGWIADGAPVPEPATMLLLGSGLIGIGALVRRKFKR